MAHRNPENPIMFSKTFPLFLSATALVAGADPMGAAGTPTEVGKAPDPNAPKPEKKPRAKAADDTDAPRRKALVDGVFAEAAKLAPKDKDGKPLEGEALKAAQRDAANAQLLIKSEGKDGVKLKPSDFSEAAGGKKGYWFFRKAFYLARVQECQDKIDGKTTSDPAAMVKKAAKAQEELKKLMQNLIDAGIDPETVGLAILK